MKIHCNKSEVIKFVSKHQWRSCRDTHPLVSHQAPYSDDATTNHWWLVKKATRITLCWLVVSTHLKHISQNGNLPQVGVKIKNIWNHHLVCLFKSRHGRQSTVHDQLWANLENLGFTMRLPDRLFRLSVIMASSFYWRSFIQSILKLYRFLLVGSMTPFPPHFNHHPELHTNFTPKASGCWGHISDHARLLASTILHRARVYVENHIISYHTIS